MTVEFAGNTEATRGVRIARAAADERIGTDALLVGLAAAAPGIARVLDAVDVTPTVLRFVVSDQQDRRSEPDGPDGGGDGFTAGALEALRRCAAEPGAEPRSAENLLAAVLHDQGTWAAAVLETCGVDVDEVRQALRTGRIPEHDDRVAPPLRDTRDKMIGRDRYRGRGLRDRLLSMAVPIRINYAAAPVMWVSLEADDIAARHGGDLRTDDLLRAMAATYAVSRSYPHLTRPAAAQYAGSHALAEAGADWERLAAAAAADLGTDGVPATSVLRRRSPNWPRDTGELLRRLLADENTRAVRLLRVLGVDVRELAG